MLGTGEDDEMLHVHKHKNGQVTKSTIRHSCSYSLQLRWVAGDSINFIFAPKMALKRAPNSPCKKVLKRGSIVAF